MQKTQLVLDLDKAENQVAGQNRVLIDVLVKRGGKTSVVFIKISGGTHDVAEGSGSYLTDIIQEVRMNFGNHDFVNIVQYSGIVKIIPKKHPILCG